MNNSLVNIAEILMMKAASYIEGVVLTDEIKRIKNILLGCSPSAMIGDSIARWENSSCYYDFICISFYFVAGKSQLVVFVENFEIKFSVHFGGGLGKARGIFWPWSRPIYWFNSWEFDPTCDKDSQCLYC